jgi:hypothetical protein
MSCRGSKSKSSLVTMDLSFAPKGADKMVDYPKIAFLFEITSEDGKLKAKIRQRLTHSTLPAEGQEGNN